MRMKELEIFSIDYSDRRSTNDDDDCDSCMCFLTFLKFKVMLTQDICLLICLCQVSRSKFLLDPGAVLYAEAN